jgi:hypothetical protein
VCACVCYIGTAKLPVTPSYPASSNSPQLIPRWQAGSQTRAQLWKGQALCAQPRLMILSPVSQRCPRQCRHGGCSPSTPMPATALAWDSNSGGPDKQSHARHTMHVVGRLTGTVSTPPTKERSTVPCVVHHLIRLTTGVIKRYPSPVCLRPLPLKTEAPAALRPRAAPGRDAPLCGTGTRAQIPHRESHTKQVLSCEHKHQAPYGPKWSRARVASNCTATSSRRSASSTSSTIRRSPSSATAPFWHGTTVYGLRR